MRYKRAFNTLAKVGIRVAQAKASTKALAKLELLVEVASFIPHPTVKAISRGATTGLLLYKQYRRLKAKA